MPLNSLMLIAVQFSMRLCTSECIWKLLQKIENWTFIVVIIRIEMDESLEPRVGKRLAPQQ